MLNASCQLMWTAPPGWLHKESITLLHPLGFANIIFSSEPVSREMDSESYATTQGDLLRKEFPGYHELEFQDFDLVGVGSGFKRMFSWVPPDGVPVTQVQIYAVRDGRGYTATATAPSDQFYTIDQILLHALRNLSVRTG